MGLPEKMLEPIIKDFEFEVLDIDRDLFRQPEVCSRTSLAQTMAHSALATVADTR